jgi:hypothetical protein
MSLPALAGPPPALAEKAWTPEERATLITPWSIGLAAIGTTVRDLRALYPAVDFRCRDAELRLDRLLSGSWVVAEERGEVLFALRSGCSIDRVGELNLSGYGKVFPTLDDVTGVAYTTSPRFATPEGVRVGDTLAEAAKVYGTPVVARFKRELRDEQGREIFSSLLDGPVTVFWEAVYFPFAVPPKGQWLNPRYAEYGNYTFIAEPSASHRHVGKWRPADRRRYKDFSYGVDLNARITAIAPGRAAAGYGEGTLCAVHLRAEYQARLNAQDGRRARLPRYSEVCEHRG